MNKSYIYELVNAKKKELNLSYSRENGYEFIEYFLENNKVSNILDFLNIDIWDCIKCIYYMSLEDKDIYSSNEKIDEFRVLFSGRNISFVENFLDLLKALRDKVQYQFVVKYVDDSFLENEDEAISCIETGDTDDDVVVVLFKDFENRSVDVSSLIETYRKDPDVIIDLINYYINFRKINRFRKSFNNAFDDVVCDKIINNKVADKIFKEKASELYDIPFILGKFRSINDYFVDIQKEEKKEKRRNIKEINNIDNSLRLFDDAITKKEICNFYDIVKNINDEEIKVSILKYIYEHNNKYYDELKNEFEILDNNSDLKYRALLNEINIFDGEYSLSNVKRNSVVDLAQIVKFLISYNFSKKDIVSIIENTNLDIVSSIKLFLDRGYLLLEVLYSNIDIFYEKSNKYSMYLKSVELLNKYHINPNLFNNNFDVLVSNYSLFMKNLKLISDYYFIDVLNNSLDYSYLIDDDLSKKIDMFLEFGYEEYLLKNLDILNTPHIDRLKILKILNINVNSYEELFEYLNTDSFFVNDSDISLYVDNYLTNDSCDKDISCRNLQSFRSTSRVYDFNGVYVSSIKVNRLLAEGNNLNDSIFYNMTLNKDEYDRVVDAINPDVLVKR